MTTRLLYITIDGILGHLGFSQVVRVVEGLADLGHSYVIVSLERDAELRDTRRVEWLRARLLSRGIRWHCVPYLARGTGYALRNQARLATLALDAVRRYRVTHVHARGYHGALVAVGLGRPWIFDARGYWIDERIEEARWFTTPTRLAAARAVERTLYRRAAHVVTLTDLHADDLRTGRYGTRAERVTVIPTCADYADFRLREDDALTPDRPLTVGIVGSINRAYLVDHTVRLAAELVRRAPTAQIHVLSADHARWHEGLVAAGVPPDAIRAGKAAHEEMPSKLRALDWLLLLLTQETKAKRAMMPTKLAECFASGVRVCAHGCNREVIGWVQDAGGGTVLADVSDSELTAAAVHCATADRTPNLAAREASTPHFSLASGIDRYGRLLRQLA